MKVHVVPAGLIQTNAYVLTDAASGSAVLIDAPDHCWADVKKILELEACQLAEIWFTHGHWDHTQGAPEIIRETGARTRAHRSDQTLIENPEVMKRFLDMEFLMEPVKVDIWVGQDEHWTALGETVQVRHVPGHAPGNVLFYFPACHAAFVGDAIFNGSIGRTDLPGGSFEELERAIREQIYTLPDETMLYPGHGPTTTVAAEKQSNSHVRP